VVEEGSFCFEYFDDFGDVLKSEEGFAVLLEIDPRLLVAVGVVAEEYGEFLEFVFC
jgi:hypothetical protein